MVHRHKIFSLIPLLPEKLMIIYLFPVLCVLKRQTMEGNYERFNKRLNYHLDTVHGFLNPLTHVCRVVTDRPAAV